MQERAGQQEGPLQPPRSGRGLEFRSQPSRSCNFTTSQQASPSKAAPPFPVLGNWRQGEPLPAAPARPPPTPELGLLTACGLGSVPHGSSPPRGRAHPSRLDWRPSTWPGGSERLPGKRPGLQAGLHPRSYVSGIRGLASLGPRRAATLPEAPPGAGREPQSPGRPGRGHSRRAAGAPGRAQAPHRGPSPAPHLGLQERGARGPTVARRPEPGPRPGVRSSPRADPRLPAPGSPRRPPAAACTARRPRPGRPSCPRPPASQPPKPPAQRCTRSPRPVPRRPPRGPRLRPRPTSRGRRRAGGGPEAAGPARSALGPGAGRGRRGVRPGPPPPSLPARRRCSRPAPRPRRGKRGRGGAGRGGGRGDPPRPPPPRDLPGGGGGGRAPEAVPVAGHHGNGTAEFRGRRAARPDPRPRERAHLPQRRRPGDTPAPPCRVRTRPPPRGCGAKPLGSDRAPCCPAPVPRPPPGGAQGARGRREVLGAGGVAVGKRSGPRGGSARGPGRQPSSSQKFTGGLQAEPGLPAPPAPRPWSGVGGGPRVSPWLPHPSLRWGVDARPARGGGSWSTPAARFRGGNSF